MLCGFVLVLVQTWSRGVLQICYCILFEKYWSYFIEADNGHLDLWHLDLWFPTCDGDVSLATLGLKKWQMVEYVGKSMNIRPYLSLRVRTRISRHEEEKMQEKIAPLLFAFIIN